MNFSTIFRATNKRGVVIDVVFYFVISALVATTVCYLIFLIKNNILKESVKAETELLLTVGTEQQKKHEEEVIGYQKKVNDFSQLLKNHEFTSHAFDFMMAQTLPNVWFKQFSLDQKGAKVQLSGETDDLEYVSRQVASFERNKNIKSVGNVSSSLAEGARSSFVLSLEFDQKVFDYVSSLPSVEDVVSPSDLPVIQQQTNNEPAVINSGKEIISFRLLLSPEVLGSISPASHEVLLSVSDGTDLKKIIPSIIISPKANISPASNILQDFTGPIIYKVTAEDGSVQDYKVTVIIAPELLEEKPAQSKFTILIIIVSVVIVIIIALTIFLFIRKKNNVAKKTPRIF